MNTEKTGQPDAGMAQLAAGILMILGTVSCFACMDAIAKKLGTTMTRFR